MWPLVLRHRPRYFPTTSESYEKRSDSNFECEFRCYYLSFLAQHNGRPNWTNLFCNWQMDGEGDSFNSSDMTVGWVIVANELISDMELWMSLKSRFSAAMRNSLPTFISDDLCRRCDDDVFATRDVVVLDFVEDELLLLWTFISNHTNFRFAS